MTKKELNAKIINKAFDLYSLENKEAMKKKYPLVICNFKKIKHDIDTIENYMHWFKNIKRAERKIIFWGAPIQLSYKQFVLLRILLEQEEIIEDEFNSLIFWKEKCKKPQQKQKDDIKKTVSDFKRKFKKEINKHCEENDCYFTEMGKEEFKKIFDDLIYYKVGIGSRGYTLVTNFSISPPLKSKNTKKYNIKECKHDFI